MSYIVLALLLYILYRFIFGFVIPIVTASRKVQQRMKDMHMNNGAFTQQDQFGSSTQQASKPTASRNDAASSSKDYIEFEEIK